MPTLNNMEIPKSRNWQDFEQLVKSYLRMKCPNYMIALFGRGGQTQHGVDVYLWAKNASFIGVQCKKVERLTYLETGLTVSLQMASDDYQQGEKENVQHLDCLWSELYGSINADLWEGIITDEQARYLRDKYLGI